LLARAALYRRPNTAWFDLARKAIFDLRSSTIPEINRYNHGR